MRQLKAEALAKEKGIDGKSRTDYEFLFLQETNSV
jgi:hypothetical protein